MENKMAIGNLKAILIGYLGRATEYGREIWAPGESNGAIPVNVQDQSTRSLDLKFIKVLAPPTTISVAASPGDTTLTVTSTTGFADQVVVGLVKSNGSSGNFYFGEQVGALSGSIVTLDTPIDKPFPAGSNVFAATHHMNVDGSSTTQVYQIGPVGAGTAIEVDTTRIMGYIEDELAMDDAKFGGITRLTKGIVLRTNHQDGTYTNHWNSKSNGEFALIAFDATYTDKAPAGQNGFRLRNTYAGQSKHGVTIRLAPGETLELLVQDNLTGLTDLGFMAQGHVVTD
jgi:hypothetical protein